MYINDVYLLISQSIPPFTRPQLIPSRPGHSRLGRLAGSCTCRLFLRMCRIVHIGPWLRAKRLNACHQRYNRIAQFHRNH